MGIIEGSGKDLAVMGEALRGSERCDCDLGLQQSY